ncbi:MAG: LPXTG cell wall anchor domain-containing protein [Eggerthellaceae bacterium]|nr:LPXTG cell wall anchor domain-containing protein [Eggerthellaceae bacterium]
MNEQTKRPQRTKRFLAIAISAVLAFGCMPATAFAAEGGATSTRTEPVVAPDASGNTDVVVDGDVAVKIKGEDGTPRNAVDVSGSASATVSGNVSVEPAPDAEFIAVTGIHVDASDGTSASANVEGNVTAEGTTGGNATGVSGNSGGGSCSVNIGGDVKVVVDDESDATGALVTSKSQSDSYKLIIGSDLIAIGGSEYSAGLVVTGGSSTPVTVVVGGTISSTGAGVNLRNSDETHQKRTAASLLDLTAWKIEAGSDDELFETEVLVSDGAEGLAKAVNYIVKVDDAVKGLLGYDDSGLATKSGEGYEYVVAHEGDKIYLKALDESWRIKGVSGEGYGMDDKGYYFTVPRGGGIMLIAEMEAVPTPALTPTKASAPIASSSNAGSSNTLPATGDSSLTTLASLLGAAIAAAAALFVTRRHVRG